MSTIISKVEYCIKYNKQLGCPTSVNILLKTENNKYREDKYEQSNPFF